MSGAALKVDRAGKLRLSEADVTQQCVDFLRAERWTCKRQHVGVFIPLAQKDKPDPQAVTIGETGDPDWLIMRVLTDRLPDGGSWPDLFYLEFKRPGGRLRPGQKLAHKALRKDGWLVCVAHGLDELREWMAMVGLA